MTPVDLNRLREARGRRGSIGFEFDDLYVGGTLLDAVLEAPTVWWCINTSAQSKCEPDSPIPWPPRHDDCGLVALVPVKGANDAT